MGLFGRRKPEEGSELPRYLIPPEAWDDPRIGGMLKALGKMPEDPENLVLTSDDVARKIADGRTRIAQKTREINEALIARGAAARVIPMWLIQANCWGGDIGHFLVYILRLTPYDDWNVVYLPDDEVGSALLDLPVHPGGSIPAFADYGAQQILELKRRLLEALAEAENSFDFGYFADAQKEAVEGVKAIANYFSTLLVEAHDRTKRRYR